MPVFAPTTSTVLPVKSACSGGGFVYCSEMKAEILGFLPITVETSESSSVRSFAKLECESVRSGAPLYILHQTLFHGTWQQFAAAGGRANHS